MNRLTTKTYPDSTRVAYSYDDASRLTQVQDATGTYSFLFDNMGRLNEDCDNFNQYMKNLEAEITPEQRAHLSEMGLEID